MKKDNDVMSRIRFLGGVLAAATTVACGGAESPDAQTLETPEPPEGITGRAPAAYQGVPSVVILSTVGSGTSEPPSEVVVMDQLGLAFTPAQLIVRAGQTVRFVNSESLAHNVNVRLMANDSSVYLADMDPGDSTEIVLVEEGGYDVTCDVHPGMRAFVYVTSSPFAAFAEDDGTFLITGVPSGAYTASVWTVPSGLGAGRSVEVTGASTRLDLTASQ